jgi:precorrin-6A synthase
MRKLIAIGIGAGDPEHLTVQAIAALNRVDVFFVMDKGEVKGDLVRLRKQICERYIRERAYRFVELPDPVRDPAIESYSKRVEAWHAQRASLYEAAIARELGADGVGGLLIWGDPSLYDSTLRILEQLSSAGLAFELEVIPGISSVSALAAAHRIPLHRIGGALHITTGRQLATDAAENDDPVVMLDGECAFSQLDPDAFEIFWGAYLGTPKQLLRRGKLRDMSVEIEAVRGAARTEHGWMFDIYYLRRIR